ncbi:MAG: hypothetical protein ABF914_09270 [Leuconostoc pseudomesenteroides]|uniref:hypothetical protein n=4 Tax=Leuconostoc pseudomesenteroides TaxID=33968 RepID=UPI0039E8EE33
MRSSKKSTFCIFVSILLLLLGTILANYIYSQKNKNVSRKYLQEHQSKKDKNKIHGKNIKNPARSFTLTGPINSGKSLKDLGYMPGFYDVHLTGKNTQFLSSNGLSNSKDEYGRLLNNTDPINLEDGTKIEFTPAKFAKLKRQGQSYVVTNPGNYLPDIQIPAGEYQVTYRGNLISQEVSASAKAGSVLSLSVTTYEGTVIPKSTQEDNFNVTLYEAQGKDSGNDKGLLSVQKNRLVTVSMMNVVDKNVAILLTPITKSSNSK